MTERRRGRPPHPDVLTPAEWRVVHWVRHGLNNRQIARHLGVSLDAVKYHLRNILGKSGAGSRAELRAWAAVPNNSALARQQQTQRGVMAKQTQLGNLGQVSRNVRDIEAAQRWYRDVLGLQHLYTFGTLAFFDCDGVRLFLEQSEAPGPESVLYFRVADIQQAVADLTERGVQFGHPPHMIHRHEDGTEEWMAFFEDLEGRPLALMSQVAG